MAKSIHTDEYQLFIKLLRKYREDACVTQGQLAAELDVSQAVISKIESCERRLDIIELRKICKILGVSLETFVKNLDIILNNGKS